MANVLMQIRPTNAKINSHLVIICMFLWSCFDCTASLLGQTWSGHIKRSFILLGQIFTENVPDSRILWLIHMNHLVAEDESSV